MKFLTAADGHINDWVHVLVDSVPYCVHRKRSEIHCEAKDAADLYMFNIEKHRKNLADKAFNVHLSEGASCEKPESWTVKHGGKSMSISWDGVMVNKKAASAVTAASREDIALQMYKRPYSQLSDEERANVDQMAATHGVTQPPAAPAHNPQMTNLSPMTPLAPGASFSIRWFRSADENPFAKKDDKDEKKEDKKEEDKGEDKPKGDKKPFPPKKDDDKKEDKDDKKGPPKSDAPKKDKAPSSDKPKKDSPAGEEKDIADAKKAIEILEKLLKREEGEDEPHAGDIVEALELLKKFLAEEGKEDHGMPGPKPPMGPGAPMKMDMKPMPMPAPAPGPMPKAVPLPGPMSSFGDGDFVWRKADVNTSDSVDVEPGRVVAIGGGKVIVDWGEDDILSEENPGDLVIASKADGEDSLFSSSTNAVAVEAPEATDDGVDVKAEVEAILAKTSLKDLLSKESLNESNANAIVHLGTNQVGEFLAKGSDGRLLVKVAGEEFFAWPYELRFINKEEEI